MITENSIPIKLLNDIEQDLRYFEIYNYVNSIINLKRSLLGNIDSEASRKILNLYVGGMSSFNDIVLQRNGKVDFERMKIFDLKRNELYEWALSNI